MQQPAVEKPFSLHWELKTIMYTGVLLLTSGLGILVYKNIDTIGHQAILACIALICAGSFYYCLKNKNPFSWNKVDSPNIAYDYILLLACLTFISFIGYLQFQYNVFGTKYGLATFIPMVVLFVCAYYFDHLGVLSMAITSLAAWAGIALTPQSFFANDFGNYTLLFTGLVLGTGLTIIGAISMKRGLKKHFEFTYLNFGLHLLFVSAIAAMFTFERIYAAGFLLVVLLALYFFRLAQQRKSFYILLMLTLYSYFALSAFVLLLFFSTLNAEMAGVYISFLYFIGSAIGLVLFLLNMNKKLKK